MLFTCSCRTYTELRIGDDGTLQHSSYNRSNPPMVLVHGWLQTPLTQPYVFPVSTARSNSFVCMRTRGFLHERWMDPTMSSRKWQVQNWKSSLLKDNAIFEKYKKTGFFSVQPFGVNVDGSSVDKTW